MSRDDRDDDPMLHLLLSWAAGHSDHVLPSLLQLPLPLLVSRSSLWSSHVTEATCYTSLTPPANLILYLWRCQYLRFIQSAFLASSAETKVVLATWAKSCNV